MEIDDKVIEEIVRQVLEKMKVQKKEVQAIRQEKLYENGVAQTTYNVKEVGIAIGPAFCKTIFKTLNGLPLQSVLKEIVAGIEEAGMIPRIIRITRTSDVAFMGNDCAKLVGSGVAVGIQSKGTAVIHQKDLDPLTNLELFPQAPLLTLEIYRDIGKNAAKYAKGELVKPIPIQNDPMVRPKYQVKAALMHTVETECVIEYGKPINMGYNA